MINLSKFKSEEQLIGARTMLCELIRLQNEGWNIGGSILGICLAECHTGKLDILEEPEPIEYLQQ